MDPFVQRMLARSKARRERRNAQVMNAGQEVSTHRSPLQDYNQAQVLKATAQVSVEVTKSDAEPNTINANVTPSTVECVSPHFEEGDENSPKENISVGMSEKPGCTSAIRDSARSRLRRLGALYADSQLSSPIHKTEAHFSAEQSEVENEEPHQTHLKLKSGARLAKLAMLADTIKHWEDDLSHPTAISSHDITAQNKGSTGNYDNHGTSTEETCCSQIVSKPNLDQQCLQVVKTRQFMLDDSTVANLGEGIGDKTCNITAAASSVEDSKLATIQENVSNTKLDSVKLLPVQGSQNPAMGMNALHSSSGYKVTASPGKRNVVTRSAGSPCVPNVPKMGLRVGSPLRGDSSPRTGLVLHKAALFESSPTKKSGRDPAELSVAERLAMFESNKGPALIPKAAFSMPVPTKYLEEKNVPNKICSPGKGNRMVNNILAQLQGSVTSNVDSNSVLPPGKGSGHVSNQANKSCIDDMAPLLPAASEDLPTRSSKALAQMFERGNTTAVHNDNIKNVQSERQKEMEMLLNRWNKNKLLTSSRDCSVNAESARNVTAVLDTQKKQECCGPPPPPPPLPTPADLLQVQIDERVAGSTPSKSSQDSNVSPLKILPVKYLNASKSPSPEEREKAQDCHNRYKEWTNVKRIKVRPPKRGRLYPCLSDIEATTETESEIPDESFSNSDMDSSGEECASDSSFGHNILMAAGIQRPLPTKNRGQESQTDSSDEESGDMGNVDDFMEEALSVFHGSKMSPSPPKKAKDNHLSPQRGCCDQEKKHISCSPGAHLSHSFEYSKGSPTHKLEPDSIARKTEHIPAFVVEGSEQVPLMHTVSFYRRQQKLAMKGTPVHQVVKHLDPELGKLSNETELEEESVHHKILVLQDEVKKQESVISQASQALNLCYSTIEFSGSAEQVEGERLLLVATQRRQAMLHELQRLRVEGSWRPGGCNSELSEQGSVFISDVTLLLKKDYLRAMAADEWCHHFLYLVRCQEQVLASQVLPASSETLRQGGTSLLFPGSVKLSGLYSDFKVTLEIHTLQTNREVLPHEVKYHISGKKDGKGNKLRLTPKKQKPESRMVTPSVLSPGGPSAVRSPAFKMSGYVVFSLKELRRTQFTLNKVGSSCPLEGNIRLKLSSELELNVMEKGFLTMFEDVSGFGAWHRRWCVLEGAVLSYWKYPEDEKRKVKIGQIDLSTCTTDTVDQVSRVVCARPNTFLLEITRPALPEDQDSLVLLRHDTHTVIRHLLSADTREDRLLWCAQLNKTLAMLRAWGSKTSNP